MFIPLCEGINCLKFKLFVKGIGDLTRRGTSNKLIFPLMALLAGILGGLFGIGGGMLISPLLLQIGTAPEVILVSMYSFQIVQWLVCNPSYHFSYDR